MLITIGSVFHKQLEKCFSKSPRIIGRIYAFLMAFFVFLIRLSGNICSGFITSARHFFGNHILGFVHLLRRIHPDQLRIPLATTGCRKHYFLHPLTQQKKNRIFSKDQAGPAHFAEKNPRRQHGADVRVHFHENGLDFGLWNPDEPQGHQRHRDFALLSLGKNEPAKACPGGAVFSGRLHDYRPRVFFQLD